MDSALLLAISLFAFVMSVTPGPNNIMLLASGAQFGYQRTLPHMFGIIVGMACLLLSVLLGLGTAFQQFPELYNVLKIVGSLYLLWLAWKITTSSTEPMAIYDPQKKHQPMTLFSAACFQFVNPKAWAMSIGSMTTFTIAGEGYVESGLLVIFCFAVNGFVAISLWAYLGVGIAQMLTTVKRKRVFNYTMGCLTAATLFFILN